MGLFDRLAHAFNTFTNNEPTRMTPYTQYYGPTYSGRPDRVRFQFNNDRSLISSIYTRISIDIASVVIKHVRLDDQDRYLEDMNSGLNNCLTIEANTDQGARAFRQDIAATLCDKGVAAIVPVDTSVDPQQMGSFDILTLRVGEVVGWFPKHVRVSLYNEERSSRRGYSSKENCCSR